VDGPLALQKLLDEMPADEACGARDEVVQRSPPDPLLSMPGESIGVLSTPS
jgi:hypothetical protein